MGIEGLQGKMANVESFITLAESHGEITELTADVARRFIDKIVVHETVVVDDLTRKRRGKEVKYYKKRTQDVQVFLNCIGEFVPK